MTTNTQYLPAGTVIKTRGRFFRIEKVNPKNYRCITPSGEGWNLGRQNQLEVATMEEAEAAGFKAGVTAEVIDIPKFIALGTPVRMKLPRDRAKYPHLYVVANQGPTNLTLVQLMGGDNRTVRAHPSLLEEVDIAWEIL